MARQRVRRAVLALAAAVTMATPSGAPAAGRSPATDADTRAWWRLTAELSGDDMQGRDTGSPAHARAARLVARRFAAAGLKPAGVNGTWFQPLAMTEARVEIDGTAFDLVGADSKAKPLRFLHDITVRATAALPPVVDATLAFRGYCGAGEIGPDVAGRIVVCFAGRRAGLPDASERLKAASKAGALGLIAVDDPGFTLEPARWPEAYARSLALEGAPPPAAPNFAVMRASPVAFAAMLEGSGWDSAAILADGAASRALPAFDLPTRLRARFKVSTRSLMSENVLGLLPGSDPKLKSQILVLSAHLDGYGFGEPVNGDGLYNGALDDAAYVALLERLAQRRAGKGYARSVLFAAFTGEEKGLLGAYGFTHAPTVPKADLAADINLDQLRPLFPLKILTMHAIDQTTLGESARRVAGPMGVVLRPDLEPDRHLVSRADHWPFLQIGVPSTGFVFGYDPGTPSEAKYREWYRVRYHRPQDDLSQPLDFQAARDFDRFFYGLVREVADDPARPAFLAGATSAPLSPNGARR